MSFLALRPPVCDQDLLGHLDHLDSSVDPVDSDHRELPELLGHLDFRDLQVCLEHE